MCGVFLRAHRPSPPRASGASELTRCWMLRPALAVALRGRPAGLLLLGVWFSGLQLPWRGGRWPKRDYCGQLEVVVWGTWPSCAAGPASPQSDQRDGSHPAVGGEHAHCPPGVSRSRPNAVGCTRSSGPRPEGARGRSRMMVFEPGRRLPRLGAGPAPAARSSGVRSQRDGGRGRARQVDGANAADPSPRRARMLLMLMQTARRSSRFPSWRAARAFGNAGESVS